MWSQTRLLLIRLLAPAPKGSMDTMMNTDVNYRMFVVPLWCEEEMESYRANTHTVVTLDCTHTLSYEFVSSLSLVGSHVASVCVCEREIHALRSGVWK